VAGRSEQSGWLGIKRATLLAVATRDQLHAQTPILAAEPTSTLLRQTIDETKELVRLEIALAREELQGDLRRLKTAAVLAAVAIVLALLTLGTLMVALVLSLGGTALSAVAVSVVLAVVCAATALAAYKNVPRVPLERTRARLASDVRQIGEHVT
jgi:uncharacterized membrane protein YqjE